MNEKLAGSSSRDVEATQVDETNENTPQKPEPDAPVYKMYRWDMPTQLLQQKIVSKDETIARLQRRIAALETFLPEGLEIDDDGTVSAKNSPGLEPEPPVASHLTAKERR
jgi:hypothetical protein